MSQVFAILMTVAIFACPLLCTLGECHVRADGEARSPGCGCCQGSDAANCGGEDSCPTGPRKSNGGHSRQCICGGAVVDDASSQFAGIDMSWSLPMAVVAPQLGYVAAIPGCQVVAAPWPDVGMNRGRAICCLFNTYLC